MKKILCMLCLLALSLFLTCCNNSDGIETGNAVDSEEQQAAVRYKTYSLDEIYADGAFDENLTTPADQRMRIFPTRDVTYSVFTNWNRIYVSPDNHTLSVAPLCQDPLCSHTSLPCISYAALTTNEIVEANGMLYLPIIIDGGMCFQFIEYNPSSGKYTVLGEFENGGQLITRLGRFIYFYIARVDGQTESGKQLTTNVLYRYDIFEKSLDKLDELSPRYDFHQPSSQNGYIYYISSYVLYRCDANMQNKEKLAANVMTYEVVNGDIYYLSESSGGEYGTVFVLHTDDSSTEELYSDVTWFCIDNNTMYYSLYAPIDAFEWDFPAQDENGNQVLKPTMISVDNGNTVYSVDLDHAGSDGTAIEIISSLTNQELYIGSVFSVLNGYFYTQLKESYHLNSQKGLHTGIAAIDLDSGAFYWIEAEYVMY